MRDQNTWILLFALTFLISKAYSQESNAFDKDVPAEYRSNFKIDRQRFLDSTNPYAERAGKTFNMWNAVSKGHINYFDKDSLFSAYTALRIQENSKIVEFIKLNPGSYASLYFFQQRFMFTSRTAPGSLLQIYLLLNNDLQTTPLGKSVYESLKRKQSLHLNNEMPIFSFKTNTQQEMDLTSFRSKKYVLICFWASWCGPCVKNIPFLKEIEAAYRDKGLQVISVSVDDDSTKWLKAVEKYGMPWLQTCDLPDYITSGRISTSYEIHFVPQYFLIDKEGKLIYQDTYSNEDDQHSKLKKLLHEELD